MKKVIAIASPLICGCCLLGACYYVKNKKNMLDIIIEEIETIR